MVITITPATLDDLPTLAEINRAAYSDELASRFAHKNWRDATSMLHFYSTRLSIRLRSPTTQIFKAVDASSQQTLGFICWTLEEAGGEAVAPTTQVVAQTPSALNMDFVVAAMKVMNPLLDVRAYARRKALL
jgi:hypothetical protein